MSDHVTIVDRTGAVRKVPLDAVREAARGAMSDRCERDWQGPSDDDCDDDLRVIACQLPPRHAQAGHYGVVDDMPVEPGSVTMGRIVRWESGTDDLVDLRGRVVQRQFVSDGS